MAVGFPHYRLLSFSYFLAFVIVYRDPSRHPRLSPAERDYIRAAGATREGPAQSGEVAMLGYVAQPQGMGADDRLCSLHRPIRHAFLPRKILSLGVRCVGR
jgi:hypothetical protein